MSLPMPLSPSRASSSLSTVNERTLIEKTKIISDRGECARVVGDLFAAGQPIGLDAEGLQLERLGLLQARAWDGAIFLFRTGLDEAMLGTELRPLLEDGRVEKVMHAAAGDARALWTRGIEFWGLYDTAVAHKVICYQNEGSSLWRTNIIGLNQACDHYGIKKNPMKDIVKPGLRHRLDCFLSPSPLPADIASYSACDVEPLLDLRKATWSRIGQDHRGRFRDMCRVHLLRCLDPELARCLQRDWLKEEKRDVFIEWEETVEIYSKADVYREVSKVVNCFLEEEDGSGGDCNGSGHAYEVTTAPDSRAAHVIFENRCLAVRFCHEFSHPGAKARLMFAEKEEEEEEEDEQGAEGGEEN